MTAGGESAASSQATATPQSAAPGAPTGVTASISNATVTLSWTAVSGATSYNLYWSTTPGVTTIYYYIVTAVGTGGESAASTQAGATPVATVTTLAGGGSPGGTASGHADLTGTAATFNDPQMESRWTPRGTSTSRIKTII